MSKETFIFLVFWDYEKYPNQEDLSNLPAEIKFVVCNSATEFYEKAKKYDLTVVVINNKSTASDKGDGNINLTCMKKFLEDYEIRNYFLNLNNDQNNFSEKIKSLIINKN